MRSTGGDNPESLVSTATESRIDVDTGDDGVDSNAETNNPEQTSPHHGLGHWTGFTPNENGTGADVSDSSPPSALHSCPSLSQWSDDDAFSNAEGNPPLSAKTRSSFESTSDFGFQYIEVPAAKWTFEPATLRRYVESHLKGRVLNLFAGQTHLRHEGEVIRNDLDESIEAEYHFDATEVADFFPPRSFDTVILDPPYNVRKAREKYNGEYRGEFTIIKDQVVPLVKLGGRVIHFGYASTGMSKSRGFKKREVCLINHKGDFNDTICVVEDRVEGGLDSYENTTGTVDASASDDVSTDVASDERSVCVDTDDGNVR